MNVQVPTGYQIVHEDQSTKSDSDCYAPGPDERGRDHGNMTTPSFRILAHKEYYPLSHQLHVPPMHPAVATFEFSQAVVQAQSQQIQPNFEQSLPIIMVPVQGFPPLSQGQ